MHNIWLSLPNKEGVPGGYDVGSALIPPLKSGSISSFTLIEGSGSLTGVALRVKLSESALSGDGTISSAALSALVPASAALAGSGAISSAALSAVSSLAAGLAGSGSFSDADLSALVPLASTLSGAATLTVNLTGIGRLEAEILPFTDLSPEGLATPLLDSNDIEIGYSLRESLRLMLAATAGKVSGGGTATVTIRSATDGSDRIVATVDSNGNRTAVTHNVADE